MAVIQHTLVDPSGTPIKNTQVTINLVAGTTGGFIGSSAEILTEQWAATDHNGLWTATLTPNNQITPDGTYYRVRQLREVLSFVVPAGAGPFWLRDLLVASPAMPAMLIGAATPASVTAAVTALVNAAPLAMDTLGEIAAVIASDESAAAALLTSVAGKASTAALTAETTRAGLAEVAAQTTANAAAPAMTITAVKTGNYTATVNQIVPADATGGAFTVTLPTAPADKQKVTVKKIDTGVNLVTVASAGSDVFNVAGGTTTKTLTLSNQAATFQYASTGAIWYLTSDDIPLSQLDARFSPRWAPLTVYALGAQVVSPGNDVVTANVAHTSSAAYATDVAKWSGSGTYVPVSQKGAPGGVSSLDATGRVAVTALPNGTPPNYVALIGGQQDESPTVTNCTLTADTVNYRTGAQSWQCSFAGAVTATFTVPLLETTQMAVSGIILAVWISDASKISIITASFYSDSTPNNAYKLNFATSSETTLVTGWNMLRWSAASAVVVAGTPTWGLFHHIEIDFVTSGPATASVQSLTAICPPKAQILFIADGGYTSTDQTPGYGDLKALGIPVTWAIDCSLIGNGTHVTEARLAQIAAENGNSISFHGWDATVSSTMTAAQAQSATMKCIKWLSKRGYSGRMWRAAWLQDVATNSPATDSMVLANPMYGVSNVETFHIFPFKQPNTVQRTAMFGKTNAAYDTMFATMQANHGLLVCYFHRVADDANPDSTPTAEWTYLLAKLTDGITNGWMEGVTFETLFARSGGTFRREFPGTWIAEYPSADGTTTKVRLP